MRRSVWLSVLVLTISAHTAVSAAGGGGLNPLSREALKPVRAAAARQNEGAIPVPEPAPRQATGFNEQRNLYFGDTHVHTALSFDSYLAGNRLGIDDAYRFAMGEPLTLITGETAQLSRPLDFVVMTDHAESYGLFETCARENLTERQIAFCSAFESPSAKFFMQLRTEALKRPPVLTADLCEDSPAACREDARTTWMAVRAAAEKYNKPGRFSAFAGYEYSPVLPKQGKIHRNVIFRNRQTPDRAVSAFDAATVLDLWASLERECTGDCEFLTIPHNMNKTWGIAYSGRTMDGDAYEDKDWALRGRAEPLAEIFQIKGNSECGYGLGATDEECNFELIVPLCEGDQVAGCSGRTSFSREGLKVGLGLEQKLGFNPLRFGFVGSTDTHNSTPGDTEEYDYRGSSTLHESPAMMRLGKAGGGAMKSKNPGAALRRKTSGGLAAVWAKENTRDAIFDAMQQRETYATSGTRIQLRFFAGWQFEQGILADPAFLKKAYDGGVPMGGVLPAGDAQSGPEFVVWALQDGFGAPLQKVQMIKAWMEDGEARERVTDIACSDGLTPDPQTGRCPANGAKADISNCKVSADKGDGELKVRWKDPGFDRKQAAVYYVRVLENPSCRWSTYDSIRIGEAPPADVPATIQERAWSSPIWFTP